MREVDCAVTRGAALAGAATVVVALGFMPSDAECEAPLAKGSTVAIEPVPDFPACPDAATDSPAAAEGREGAGRACAVVAVPPCDFSRSALAGGLPATFAMARSPELAE